MQNIISKSMLMFSTLGMFIFVGCTQQDAGEESGEMMARKAVAVMNPTEGNEAAGSVTFIETEGGMQVIVAFQNVPEGEHGFHIHEFGDCSSGDGTSAGGHFNPEDNPHAGPDADMRHIGDLGNVTADTSGNVSVDFTDAKLTFDGPNSILGKGVILHADADDMSSQPTGAAGGRISCGVIELAE